MEAIQRQADTNGSWRAGFSWFYQHLAWFGGMTLCFCLGMGVNNGAATKEAVSSVQTTYQGKVEYHVQHEKVLASVAKTAVVACEHNAVVSLDNGAPLPEVKACPPVAAAAAK